MGKVRTVLFALIIFVVAIAVAGVVLYYTARQEGGELSNYVPADVLYYGKYTGLEGIWQDIKQSKYYADIKEWISKADFDNYPLLKRLAYYKVQAEAALGAPIDEELVLSLVGKECGIAVFENGIAGLFRLGANTLGKAKFALREAPVEEKYREVKIYKYGDGEKSVSFALVGDVLIASNNGDVLKHMLDAQAGETPRLMDTQIYKKFVSRVPEDVFGLGYSDVDRINSVVIRKLIGTLEVLEPEAAKTLEAVKGLRIGGHNMTYSRWVEDGGILIDYKWERGAEGEELFRLGGGLNALRVIPEDALIAYDAGINLKDYVDFVKGFVGASLKGSGQDEEIAKIGEQIKVVTGVDLAQEFYPILGSEFGFMLVDFDFEGFVPNFNEVFFFEVEDTAKMQDIISRVEAVIADKMSLSAKQVGDYKITVAQPQEGVPVSFAWGIVDKFVVAGIGEDSLRGFIQRYSGKGEDVRNSEAFALISEGLKGQPIIYESFQVKKIVEKIMGFVENIMAVNEQAKDIIPLIRALGIVDRVLIYGVGDEKNDWYSRVYVKLDLASQ